MNGQEHEEFATALAREEQRDRSEPPALRYARLHAYFSRGLYADLLRPWFDFFQRSQIICLRYDEIITNPRALAERLHRFLGVTPRPQDAEKLGIINSSEKSIAAMPEEVRNQLLLRYSQANRRLAELLGADFEVWT